MTGILNPGAIVFGLAALAYAALALWLAPGWRQAGSGRWLIVASLCSFIWCAASAADYVTDGKFGFPVSVSYVLRTGSWCLFLAVLVRKAMDAVPGAADKWWRTLTAVLAIISGLLLLLDIGIVFGGPAAGVFAVLRAAFRGYGALLLAVGGLALLENVYRLPDPDGRWSLRFLVLALGGAFALDLILNTGEVLFHRHDRTLWVARGAINALIVPLVAITAARNPKWKLDVYVSRRAAFHTLSLIAAGAYLIVTALAASYLARFQGDIGAILLTVFIFAAVIALLILLGSGRIRARLKVFVSKHFFAYSYDYREEWLSFIHTISDTARASGLRVRIIRALCDILDSPGGALWLKGRDGTWRPSVCWNLSGFDGAEAADSDLLRALSEETWIVDLDELKAGDAFYGGLKIPDWAEAEPRAWLLVPLLHFGVLEGFFMAAQPRVPQNLTWEGRDLLKTAGRQAASYLAEQRAEQEAQEAREFEAFNRRFAYVMHDVKNLLSQLRLVVRNAEIHAGNPDFQKDMLATVRDAAEKMSQLLARLSRQTGQEAPAFGGVDLVAIAQSAAAKFQASHGAVKVVAGQSSIRIVGDAERLDTALSHLIQNGFEAGAKGEDGVRLEAGVSGSWAVLKVIDRGRGMSRDFIENNLFRPFHTTKASGYGIGLYEVRAIAEAHGGTLEVSSHEGEGTEMALYLPLPAGKNGSPGICSGDDREQLKKTGMDHDGRAAEIAGC